jgi:hypothetical protein
MSFETINNRITQIENKITEIDSLVNVGRGQKPIHEQMRGLYDILLKYHERLIKIEQQLKNK